MRSLFLPTATSLLLAEHNKVSGFTAWRSSNLLPSHQASLEVAGRTHQLPSAAASVPAGDAWTRLASFLFSSKGDGVDTTEAASTATAAETDGAQGINGDTGSDPLAQARSAAERFFGPNIDILQYTLQTHKPLGCTAEQSLVEEDDGSKHVFVSKVKKDGNAAKAGIVEGDVIIGVTGSFDDVMIVTGLGLEDVV